ncbi:short chain dehydrogenase reductase [Favolaschia claudopus]|uniref:Short chain dehydrogenase reductase n=1 Tax=Favolaschia claudopus TaxID=2862362 RepID=A0AAW0CJI2_9AGAR
MPTQRSQRTVLITGCTDGGIGAELAKEYHSRGLRVFATSRRVDTMKGLAALGIETLALDVLNVDSIRTARETISSRTEGKLDILVNNAGKLYEAAVIDSDMNEMRSLFELNVFAHMSMVQDFIQLLMAGQNACIVNIGSGAGLLPVPLQAGYNASKAAIHAFSDTLRVELEPFNIRVITTITSAVKSNIFNPVRFPEHSLYKSLEGAYNEMHVETNRTAVPTDKFARELVSDTLKSRPPNYSWGGTSAGLIWFLTSFFPRWVPTKVVTDMYGFNKFSAQVRKERAKVNA